MAQRAFIALDGARIAKQYVVRQRLAAFDNDVIKTAISLGISRRALYRRLQKTRNGHQIGADTLMLTA